MESGSDRAILAMISPQVPIVRPLHRKQCIVADCHELIAPTMWRSHMGLHARGLFRGDVPREWLQEQGLYICDCRALVAKSRRASHSRRCVAVLAAPPDPAPIPSLSETESSHSTNTVLPSFEEVCLLSCRTLRHIPKKSRPAFALALSFSLKAVLHDNSLDSWLKLFMLPKCLLPSKKRGGRHNKPTPIDALCNLWCRGEHATLWNMAMSHRAIGIHSDDSIPRNLINFAVSLSREGMFAKACRILASSGLAPNSDDTWKLLKDKHPEGPLPIIPETTSQSISLNEDFDVYNILKSFPKGTAAGPSGLRVQHLLDAASIPLPTTICSLLRRVVNLLVSGKVPQEVSRFMAGGSLTALSKLKPGCAPDIRPIAVGEVLRRLTGKCLCAVIKHRVVDFFEPIQFGVACPMGSEKVIHGIRACVDKHWNDLDFSVLKVDFKNAFNLVSRDAVLQECAKHFPDLLPWVAWCYGSHPFLWHPMGQLTSQSGVQQGDPLGPFLFALVLHKVAGAIKDDTECNHLLYQAWYLDDGILAGKKSSICRSLTLIQELGPPLGLHINISKCELYCPSDASPFPPELKVFQLPHFEILGCPIGDYIYCANFIASKRLEARKLLHCLIEVSVIDPQVALTLLRLCGSFCKLSYLARSIPTNLVSDAFKLFDDDIHHCFMDCIGFEMSDEAWCQAQLGLNSGGLGLRSLSLHSSSAFIASFCSSGVYDTDDIHLTNALDHFNSTVAPIEKLSVNSVVSSPVSQKLLSSKVNDYCFQVLFDESSPANKARLLSVSAPHATSWLSVIPSTSLALHLDPIEFRVAVKWWLGQDTSQGSQCAFCPAHSLDPLGHHALTCKCGGDVITRHNALRDTLAHFLHRAHASIEVEAGAGLFPDHSQSRPADILVKHWNHGRPVALDISVVSPLNPSTLAEAGATVGAVLDATERRKHQANDVKCLALGWVSTPLVVDSYGAWGNEASIFLAQIIARLAIHKSLPKAQISFELFASLSICLTRANARAILRRIPS